MPQNYVCLWLLRPDTSWRQWRPLPSCHWNALRRNLEFPHRVPLPLQKRSIQACLLTFAKRWRSATRSKCLVNVRNVDNVCASGTHPKFILHAMIAKWMFITSHNKQLAFWVYHRVQPLTPLCLAQFPWHVGPNPGKHCFTLTFCIHSPSSLVLHIVNHFMSVNACICKFV